MENRLKATSIPLTAVFDETDIRISEFLALQKDDIIRLDKELKEELLLRIGKRVKMFGVPGKSGRKMAVKVTRQISPDEKLTLEP